MSPSFVPEFLAQSHQFSDDSEHSLCVLATVGFQRCSYRLFPGFLHVAERQFAKPQACSLAVGDFESLVGLRRADLQPNFRRVLESIGSPKFRTWKIVRGAINAARLELLAR